MYGFIRCVIFRLYAPQAHRVALAGNFNHWEPLTCPLKQDKGGLWKAAVRLEPGNYEYRFVVDGPWCNSPEVQQVPNAYGTCNCLLHVN